MSNPIQMPNRKLAEGMITAGIPFAGAEHGGPCINEYTPGFLRDRRFIGTNPISPLEFERKVIEVASGGVAGHVTWFFERTAKAEGFIEGWDKTSDLIRRHREYEAITDAERGATDAPPALPDVPDAIIAQVLCMHANNMTTIKRLPFVNSPQMNTLGGKFIPAAGDRKTSTGVPIGHTTGAGKVWTVGLDNETRALMKLHPKIQDWKQP